jgi:hypothetical protein
MGECEEFERHQRQLNCGSWRNIQLLLSGMENSNMGAVREFSVAIVLVAIANEPLRPVV